jgi:DUF4097 and DUF4098 domain-containing protein YvlB
MTGTFHRATLVGMALLGMGLSATSARAAEYNQAYTISKRADVHVDTDDGSVTVTSSDANQVEFRVTYEGYVLNKSLHIESSQHGDEVELSAKVPAGFFISLTMSRKLHIEVRMPKDADLQVKSSDGSIKAGSLTGNINLQSSDGGITVNSLKGTVRMHSSDGTIAGSDLDCSCDAASSDGGIRLSGRFDQLAAKSSDGSITIEALSGSKVNSGWSIATSDGAIDLALPSDLSANIDATSGDGSISSDIPITVEGAMSKSKLHGKMNGGGASISLHSGDGSIRLRQVH